MRVLGIDPGLMGGLVLLADDGMVADHVVMPTVTTGNGKRDVDAHRVAWLIEQWKPGHAFLEKVASRPGQGVASSFSFGKGYGVVLGVLAASATPFTEVRPQTWQRTILGDLSRDDTKAASRIVAMRLWPTMDWRPTERSRVPHDGLTDAACIAEHGRRALQGLQQAA